MASPFLRFVCGVRCDFHHEIENDHAILCVMDMPFRVAQLIICRDSVDLTHSVKPRNFNLGRKLLRFVSVEGWKIRGKIKLRGILKSTSR